MIGILEAPLGAGLRERIASLDVLRGIALLGMFLVHFHDQSIDAVTPADAFYDRVVQTLFEERFWTIFGILFGAGFALQLRRAELSGRSFGSAYLRRMAALAVFGLFTHAVFGYHVLLEYAVWGWPLIFVRRWSIRMLTVALVISAASGSIYAIARTGACVVRQGDEACRSALVDDAATSKAFRKINNEQQQSVRYEDVFRARLRHIRWFYVQWYSFLPVNTFTLFLIGVIALRLGVFEHPEQHRAFLLTAATAGAVAWSAALWILQPAPAAPEGPLLAATAVAQARSGFGIVRETWLSFTYMSLVLLAFGRDRAWLSWLAPFGWTGRMSLTNYVIQVAILDLLFANYAAAVKLSPLEGCGAAIALFLFFAALSRWWLTRFRFGPCEWLWRSATYARWQPWRG